LCIVSSQCPARLFVIHYRLARIRFVNLSFFLRVLEGYSDVLRT